ncbi:MAG: HD domain-containing protein [Hyphomicrobiales bacterium]
MTRLPDNAQFAADYEKLRSVSLNPERHTAPDAHAHCEGVRQRVLYLARLNGCTDQETALLEELAYLHDIGKIEGTARPAKSVELLPRYGVEDPHLIALVKYHDTNLPWFKASERGETPGAKAWQKLARQVDIRLLCLFMVADRVDCPGGWCANAALVWFLDQVNERALAGRELVLDD